MSDSAAFLTIREVSAVLRISVPRAYALAAEGLFPSIRLSGRRIRVPRAAFDRWLETQAEKALANVRETAVAANR